RLVDANMAAAQFYGWPVDSLRGRPLGDIDRLSEAEHRAERDRAAAEGRSHVYVRHARADGSECDVEVQSAPILLDGRELRLYIVHDISVRRSAERKLFETEARYRMVVDATTQGFWFVAPHSGNTIDVNEALCAILGYAREELLGRPITDFAEGPDRAILADKVAHAPTSQHRVYEVSLTRKDGSMVLTRFNATTLRDPDGTMRGSYAFIEDITAQRAFERRLAESEGMLRSITANIPGVIYQWYERADGSRGFHWVSPRSLEILGIPQKDLERDWRIINLHPDDVERWETSIREATAAQTDWSFEGRLLLANGRILWWRGLARPVAVSPEETVFNGIILDITRQKELEAELQENRRLLNLALEAGRVGVWDFNLDTGTLWFSPSWKAQLGYADDELDNSLEAWKSVIFPEDGEAALRLVDDYIGGRKPDFEALQRFRHRDGSTVYIRTRARAVRDEKTDRPVRLIGAHVDLTPQIEAQDQLARANRNTALMLESTADGLFGVDRAGRITFVNDACQRLLGFTEAEMIGAEAHALTHHSRPDGTPYPAAECPVAAVLVDGRRREQLDDALWRKDGRPLPVEMSAAPMVDGGAVVGAIVSFRDVAERQKYKAELERSNAELEQFAYAASHDLQEPLRGVTSYLSLLKRRHGPALPEGAAAYLDQAMESALRMSNMIRDLLTYSRVSTRGQQIAPTDAGECARAALANLRISVAEAGAEVTVAEDLPRVQADAGQLTSLFQNLLGNAVKYRAPDRPPRVSVTAEPLPGGRWRFAVADNGIGVDPAYFDRIFLPFQRLHGHDQYEGTGIGLAVCRKVVERHGGTLAVRSVPGEGSVFTFDLAAAPAEEVGQDAAAARATALNPA
ncbi:MAG: PAS domain S-box protein, partial [Caenispirillum sp.]|nr:PAS domain S-box protein [Caenispirillum sp.]